MIKKFAKLLSIIAIALASIPYLFAGDASIVSIDGENVTVDGAEASAEVGKTVEKTVKVGEGTKCKVKLPDGSICVLGPNSEITISEFVENEDGTTKLLVEAVGNVVVVADLDAGSSVTIRTADSETTGRTGTIGVTTDESGGNTTVVVAAGAVVATGTESGETTVVNGGQEANVTSEGIEIREAELANIEDLLGGDRSSSSEDEESKDNSENGEGEDGDGTSKKSEDGDGDGSGSEGDLSWPEIDDPTQYDDDNEKYNSNADGGTSIPGVDFDSDDQGGDSDSGTNSPELS